MASFDDLQSKKEALVRKPLDGSLFRAPLSAPHVGIADLFGPGGELQDDALPEGWGDVGLLSTDGMGHSREVSSSDVMAFGRQTAVRSDITNDSTTLNFSAIETNLTSIELGTGAKLLPGSRDAASGALEIKKPPRPTPRQYHFLSMAVDLTDDGEIYICRYLPKGKISGYGDQSFGGGDDPIMWPATATSQFDSAYGASEAWLFGGPGWFALLEQMGFTAGTPATP